MSKSDISKVNYDECGACYVSQTALMKLRAFEHIELFNDPDGENVKSNVAGINIESAGQLELAAFKKKEEKRKSHRSQMRQVEAMNRRLAELDAMINDLEDAMGGTDVMASAVGLKFDGTETEEAKRQKIQDAYVAILATGGTLGPEQQAWLAARQEKQAIIPAKAKIEGTANLVEREQKIQVAGKNIIAELINDTHHVKTLEMARKSQIEKENGGDIGDAATISASSEKSSKASLKERIRASSEYSPDGELVTQNLPPVSAHFIVAVYNIQPVAVGELEPIVAQQIDLKVFS
ncbi:MAG: hypothetical protein JKY34_02480 [Kordiimonadaceae bacterium]|nr:hypothetical protein [Kordiimonadaceae bacterium]